MTPLDSLRPRPGLRVLITAGASGIGAVIARAFHEAGAHVHVCDIDRAALDRLATEVPGISSSTADTPTIAACIVQNALADIFSYCPPSQPTPMLAKNRCV